MRTERLIKKGLKVHDFRFLILELARFTLHSTTPVAQGGRSA